MVTELHRVDKIYFKAKQLQRKDSALVSNVAMHYMALDTKHARGDRGHCRQGLSAQPGIKTVSYNSQPRLDTPEHYIRHSIELQQAI